LDFRKKLEQGRVVIVNRIGVTMYGIDDQLFEGSDLELDEKPERRGSDPVAMVIGAAGVIAFVVGILLLPLEYIEARLLKFGEVKDDTKLPDRIVPPLPTAPDEVLPLDTNEDKAAPEEEDDKPLKQADAVSDDRLREVFDKARAFAEIQDDYVPEGHPDGVPDGDVTDPALASIGATYSHRLMRLFLDRFVVPTLLSEAELAKLDATVLIKVDIEMVIVSVRFVDESGNAMFDDSVRNAIDRVRVEVRNLPAPPEVIAPKVFGAGIRLKFNGREATYE
jgi:hypothetical protein